MPCLSLLTADFRASNSNGTQVYGIHHSYTSRADQPRPPRAAWWADIVPRQAVGTEDSAPQPEDATEQGGGGEVDANTPDTDRPHARGLRGPRLRLLKSTLLSRCAGGVLVFSAGPTRSPLTGGCRGNLRCDRHPSHIMGAVGEQPKVA